MVRDYQLVQTDQSAQMVQAGQADLVCQRSRLVQEVLMVPRVLAGP